MAGKMFGVTHYGVKRRAEEEPEGDQPITKRLARMRIGQDEQRAAATNRVPSYHLDPLHFQPSFNPAEAAENGYMTDEPMHIDDTKEKVYIHDLGSEIAQIEAEESKGIFLPDIEKRISAIPQRLLQTRTNNANTQMVLYQVPSSISVPEEQDHVRKAIIATRARVREKQARDAEEHREGEKHGRQADQVNGLIPDPMEQEEAVEDEEDADAMELG